MARSDSNFRKKMRFFAKIRVRTSRNKSGRVGTSSDKAQNTRSNPNFQKTAISETRENENFGKKCLTQLNLNFNFNLNLNFNFNLNFRDLQHDR